MLMLGLTYLKGTETPKASFWQGNCRIPEDKGLMCMSETLIAAQLWDQPRIAGDNKQGQLVITTDCC